MHHSQFAAKLMCQHCGQGNRSREWPLAGDRVPLYHQREPGRYQVKVHCPHCTQDWYVVWDLDPGPIRPLDSADEPLDLNDSYVKNKFALSSGDVEIPTGTLGIVKQIYPGGMTVVEFPTLGVEGSWLDSVFSKASRPDSNIPATRREPDSRSPEMNADPLPPREPGQIQVAHADRVRLSFHIILTLTVIVVGFLLAAEIFEFWIGPQIFIITNHGPKSGIIGGFSAIFHGEIGYGIQLISYGLTRGIPGKINIALLILLVGLGTYLKIFRKKGQ
jgi:hypothetical protein